MAARELSMLVALSARRHTSRPFHLEEKRPTPPPPSLLLLSRVRCAVSGAVRSPTCALEHVGAHVSSTRPPTTNMAPPDMS
ncbi:hypothetical protein E2C01_054548 [Portunus trituberculatus]|uniref:Uncharacterized protein n=1 Tax=Portunus trituberculatus TaxID=210409 RepID=A0A5B7GJW2_PORTR|nr:hypothetical protein [Portunus trituberculatus]